jgi:hypothetical protein
MYPQEASMRRIALITAVMFTILPSAGFAQQEPRNVIDSPPGTTVGVAPSATGMPDVVPQQGGPLNPGSPTGLDVVAEDGLSTKTVKAVPCSTAARETDGTTTCVGIPAAPERKRR